jgi:hypothetical protein
MAGKICHEHETNNIEKMASYMMIAYAYGNDSSDRRDNDWAALYNSLAEFENDHDFSTMDKDEHNEFFGNYAGRAKYNELPKNSKLLYICGSFGWVLSPISGPQDIINELLSIDWGDLTLDYEE